MEEPDVARAEAAVRRHELRIAVQPRVDQDDVGAVVGRQVAPVMDGWRVERLSDDAATLLVTGRVDAEVGTDRYARRAHALVQRLLDTGVFTRVEADLPVGAFEREDARGAFGEDEHLPGTEAKDWARKAIRCSEAWDLIRSNGGMPGSGISVGLRTTR